MSHNKGAIDRSSDALLARLKELIQTVAEHMGQGVVDVGELTDKTPLLDLPIDSLGIFELIGGIEQTYNIKIPEGKEFEWETLGDVIAYIQESSAAGSTHTGARPS